LLVLLSHVQLPIFFQITLIACLAEPIFTNQKKKQAQTLTILRFVTSLPFHSI